MNSNLGTNGQAVQNKRDLVETLLKKKASQPQVATSSFSQQRLWWLDQLEPNNTAYLITKAVWLEGNVCVRSLACSLQEIVQRHAPLRTTFQAQDGQPFQVIAPKLEFILPVVDLSHLPAVDREAKAQQQINADAKQPFNLAQGPLFRAQLLKLTEQEHVLVLSMHHIVSDGWSLDVLYRELGVLYNAFSAGLSSPLAELPIQYADYAVWQRERLQGEFLEKQLGYWKEKLAGAPELLELPAARSRPAVQTFQGATEEFQFSKLLADAVKSLAQREGVTLFMVLLAAFQVLLLRYTGQEDVVVGSPIAGRTQQETEGLIGFFANTLVMRTDLSGDPSFRELLGRVKETCLGAYEHQELPFEKIVEELAPSRNLSYNPLAQILFGVHSTSQPSLSLNSVSVTSKDAHSLGSGHDITLTIVDSIGDLELMISYSTDLFEAPTIARLLGHYQVLLEGAANNPDARLSALPLLTAAERDQLVVEFNDTAAEYPKDKCVHQLFEEQVELNPNATALVFENEQLTYGELNAKANQLAYHLRMLEVGPDVLVGICVERSLEMVVGLLGILKAGGAYVPLDPSYPKDRLAFMLEDAAPAVLLTQEKLLGNLPEHEAVVLCLDRDWPEVEQGSAENLSCGIVPANLAYVIYTSGSTGKPKGVMIEHQCIGRLVLSTSYISITSLDNVAQASNASFDAATFEIWGALLNGARLVVIANNVLLSPVLLPDVLDKHQISTLFLTTALFNHISYESLMLLPSLRNLLFGGEEVNLLRVRQTMILNPMYRLIHVYGPTENTTFSTWYLVQAVPERASTVPIGRPVSNTKAYVLDEQMELVPIGVAGELHVGGDGLARGYLNRPELTAEKFIPNPFGEGRLYKTGDLVKWRADGNLEFSGRLDHQVKIRGFRIELGEVEAALREHPAVKEVAVVAREDVPGDKRLVAYLVAAREQGRAASPSEWRSYLKGHLPAYMVPSAFVMLDKMPLTPSGKLDRWGLPVPDVKALAREAGYVAPRTPVEEELAAMWCAVLNIDKVGIHDNFFDLGGHSLLAMQIMLRIAASFQVDLSIRTLFEGPTVASLSGVIETLDWMSLRSPLIHDAISDIGYESGQI